MNISGPELIRPLNKSVNHTTGSRKGNKRGQDVNIIGNDDVDNATHDPQQSGPLNPNTSANIIYPVVPADNVRKIVGGVFTSSVYWKVELIVDAISRYTFIGAPFQTVIHEFKGFILPAGETLQIRFTNLSSNAVQVADIYSTLEFVDEATV